MDGHDDGYEVADIPALVAAARAHADAFRFPDAQERARAVLDLAGSDERYAEARSQAEAVLERVGWTPAQARKRNNKAATRRARSARVAALLQGPDPVDVERERRRRDQEEARNRAAGEIQNAGRMGNQVEASHLRMLARHPDRISGRPQARKVIDRLERDADIARSIDNVEGAETARARMAEIRERFAL